MLRSVSFWSFSCFLWDNFDSLTRSIFCNPASFNLGFLSRPLGIFGKTNKSSPLAFLPSTLPFTWEIPSAPCFCAIPVPVPSSNNPSPLPERGRVLWSLRFLGLLTAFLWRLGEYCGCLGRIGTSVADDVVSNSFRYSDDVDNSDWEYLAGYTPNHGGSSSVFSMVTKLKWKLWCWFCPAVALKRLTWLTTELISK